MKQSVPDQVKSAMDACLYVSGSADSVTIRPDSAAGVQRKPGRAAGVQRKPGGVPEPGSVRILAAVSGGADSVCLLLCLRELGYDVYAAHVEHGIRGEESLEDCAFVRKLCNEHAIPLRIVSVDVKAAVQEHTMSLEEAARNLRWKALFQTAREWGISVIATAHHRMDQAETVLWNLIRGSSTPGLGGIRPVRREDGCILIRPLLECGKAQIEEYLQKRGVSWRTDSTNADTNLTRNAIRLKILPALEALNQGAVQHIANAASDLRQVEDWLAEQTDAAWADAVLENEESGAQGQIAERGCGAQDQIAEWECQEKDLLFDRNALRKCPDVLRTRVLRRMIAYYTGREQNISRAHILALDRLVFSPNGHSASLPCGVCAISEEGILRLTRKRNRKTEEVVPLEHDGRYYFPVEDGGITADVSFLTWPGGEVLKKKYTKYLAYDTIAPCIVLRTRREGDYLTVNASLGRKKLKDYLIDEKVPRSRRDSLVLAAQGSHVLWIVGMRISEAAKVTKGCRAVRISVSLDYPKPTGLNQI